MKRWRIYHEIYIQLIAMDTLNIFVNVSAHGSYELKIGLESWYPNLTGIDNNFNSYGAKFKYILMHRNGNMKSYTPNFLLARQWNCQTFIKSKWLSFYRFDTKSIHLFDLFIHLNISYTIFFVVNSKN